MKMDFMPKTRPGKWAIWLGIVFVALMVFLLLTAITIGGSAINVAAVIAENPLLSILNITLNLSLNLTGLSSLLLGILAVIKYRDWSVLKSLAVLYVLALLMFVLGEFLFPY